MSHDGRPSRCALRKPTNASAQPITASEAGISEFMRDVISYQNVNSPTTILRAVSSGWVRIISFTTRALFTSSTTSSASHTVPAS